MQSVNVERDATQLMAPGQGVDTVTDVTRAKALTNIPQQNPVDVVNNETLYATFSYTEVGRELEVKSNLAIPIPQAGLTIGSSLNYTSKDSKFKIYYYISYIGQTQEKRLDDFDQPVFDQNALDNLRGASIQPINTGAQVIDAMYGDSFITSLVLQRRLQITINFYGDIHESQLNLGAQLRAAGPIVQAEGTINVKFKEIMKNFQCEYICEVQGVDGVDIPQGIVQSAESAINNIASLVKSFNSAIKKPQNSEAVVVKYKSSPYSIVSNVALTPLQRDILMRLNIYSGLLSAASKKAVECARVISDYYYPFEFLTNKESFAPAYLIKQRRDFSRENFLSIRNKLNQVMVDIETAKQFMESTVNYQALVVIGDRLNNDIIATINNLWEQILPLTNQVYLSYLPKHAIPVTRGSATPYIKINFPKKVSTICALLDASDPGISFAGQDPAKGVLKLMQWIPIGQRKRHFRFHEIGRVRVDNFKGENGILYDLPLYNGNLYDKVCIHFEFEPDAPKTTNYFPYSIRLFIKYQLLQASSLITNLAIPREVSTQAQADTQREAQPVTFKSGIYFAAPVSRTSDRKSRTKIPPVRTLAIIDRSEELPQGHRRRRNEMDEGPVIVLNNSKKSRLAK